MTHNEKQIIILMQPSDIAFLDDKKIRRESPNDVKEIRGKSCTDACPSLILPNLFQSQH